MASSAPHSRASSWPTARWREPRSPVARSSSTDWARASWWWASGARPRFVCSSTPVALMTGVSSVRRSAVGPRRRVGDGTVGDRLAGDVDEQGVRAAPTAPASGRGRRPTAGGPSTARVPTTYGRSVGPDDVARASTVLGDAAPFPTQDGEPVFAEPWEGRAFAMAVDVVGRAGLSVGGVPLTTRGGDRGRPAPPVLRVVGRRAGAARRRDRCRVAEPAGRGDDAAASYRYHEAGRGDVEVFPVRVPTSCPACWPRSTGPPRSTLTACRHAERYRVLPAGELAPAARSTPATTLLLDVPLAAPPLLNRSRARLAQTLKDSEAGLSGGRRPCGRG